MTGLETATQAADVPEPGGGTSRLVGDVLLWGGRVIDPESGRDEPANVLIKNGRIEAIGTVLDAEVVLDARGLVVGPGFIDLHNHAQNVPSMCLQVQDGVTTALELEAGVRDVRRAAHEAAEEGRPVNYGFATSWAGARMRVLDGLEADDASIFDFTVGMDGRRWRLPSDGRTVAQVLHRLEGEIEAGAIGIGVMLGYAPETDPTEFQAVARLGSRLGVGLFTHARSKAGAGRKPLAGIAEIADVSAATGAHLHACHLNSSCLLSMEEGHQLLQEARANGARLTTEMYPYGAGMTAISAPFLAPDRLAELGLTPADLVVASTGEEIPDLKRLQQLRSAAPATLVLIRYLDDNDPGNAALLARAMSGADVAVASDAVPFVDRRGRIVQDGEALPAEARSHPRSVGTFARFLHIMRTTGWLDLAEALRRCSLLPAQILDPAVPAMRRKGRVQVGCDADLVAFSPDEVRERATYTTPGSPSAGMRHVVVGGVPVVREGHLVPGARPGRLVSSA